MIKALDCQSKLFVMEKMEMLSGIGRPEYSGVYAVCMMITTERDADGRSLSRDHYVLYVGSSNNIKRRISNPSHPFHAARSEWGALGYIVYLRSFPCDNYKEREKQAIKLFRPPMNIQHNG